ncbi:MAG: hypothetical protein K2K66_06945 [Ruminococcus sp.]|nr:hypothetical protein [Ruminococcus sp.]
MEGFTDLSYSQNPKEYSRQYVDEDFERTDIVGYAPAISYSFDRYYGNKVLDDIVKITENEYIGDLMKRRIVTVDLTAHTGTSGGNAKMRTYAVIPDTNGDTTDCLTYSGNFKACGVLVDCLAVSNDDWQTISVTEQTSYTTSAYISVTGNKVVGNISNINGNININGDVERNSSVTFSVRPIFDGAKVTLYRTSGGEQIKIASGFGEFTNSGNVIITDSTYCVTVEVGEEHTSYQIMLTAVEPLQTASTVSTTSAKSKTSTTTKE